jgi:hypothetical protein
MSRERESAWSRDTERRENSLIRAFGGILRRQVTLLQRVVLDEEDQLDAAPAIRSDSL